MFLANGSRIHVLVMLAIALPAGGALADMPVRLTQTYYLQHAMSKSYLQQGYDGTRDDKRNTEAQPMTNMGDENFKWILVRSDPGNLTGYNYLVNMKTGLALTQDNVGDTNVSNWGVERRDPQLDKRQHWRTQVVGREMQTGNSIWKMTNQASGLPLTQHDFGANPGYPNVHVWQDTNLNDRSFHWVVKDAGKIDLCKLTIESIKCIKPSTGKDAGTKFLFAAIEFTVGAVSGGSTAGLSVASTAAKEAIKQAVKAGLKAGIKEGGKLVMSEAGKVLTKQVVMNMAAQKAASTAIKSASLAAANEIGEDEADSFVELAFDKIYGTSPDQLEIQINGISVWPNGGRDWRNITSQESLPVNIEYIFPRTRNATIELREYDSGSADDSLGTLELDTSEVYRPERYEEVVIKNEDEGCLYHITLKVEPLEWRPDTDALPSSVHGAQMYGGAKIGGGTAPVKAILANGQVFLKVINADGTMSQYQRGAVGRDTFGPEQKLAGVKVTFDPLTAKAVFLIGDFIMVVDGAGSLTAQSVTGGWSGGRQTAATVRAPQAIPGHKIATDAQPVKAIFPMGMERIVVVNAAGEVWYHSIGNRMKTAMVSAAARIPGATIGVAGQPVQGIFPYDNRILWIDANGSLWAHDVGATVGPAEAIPGVRVMTDPQFIKTAFTMSGVGIIMIDVEGNVWNHKLQ